MISGFKFLQQTIQDEIDAKDSGDADQDADDLMIVDSNSSLQRYF